MTGVIGADHDPSGSMTMPTGSGGRMIDPDGATIQCDHPAKRFDPTTKKAGFTVSNAHRAARGFRPGRAGGCLWAKRMGRTWSALSCDVCVSNTKSGDHAFNELHTLPQMAHLHVWRGSWLAPAELCHAGFLLLPRDLLLLGWHRSYPAVLWASALPYLGRSRHWLRLVHRPPRARETVARARPHQRASFSRSAPSSSSFPQRFGASRTFFTTLRASPTRRRSSETECCLSTSV